MKQAFKLYCGRFDIKGVTLCMALTIGSLLFFTDYCRGQTSAQPAGYETPGVLDAFEILPPNLLEGKNYIEEHYEYVKKRKWIDTSQKEKVWVEERTEGDRRIDPHYEDRLVPSGYWEEYEEKIWIPSHYE